MLRPSKNIHVILLDYFVRSTNVLGTHKLRPQPQIPWRSINVRNWWRERGPRNIIDESDSSDGIFTTLFIHVESRGNPWAHSIHWLLSYMFNLQSERKLKKGMRGELLRWIGYLWHTLYYFSLHFLIKTFSGGALKSQINTNKLSWSIPVAICNSKRCTIRF